ncbi:hypothetical protein [Aureimonas sp. D3]|uniref:hypothetical protein n=1 Tax=Aureimonas sp. D3 TaxID=1638164 RepID=UPI0012E36D73|nr:hypothetical protein [Aureimonas sp. D3]
MTDALSGDAGPASRLVWWNCVEGNVATWQFDSEDGGPVSARSRKPEVSFDPWLRTRKGWAREFASIVLDPLGFGWMLQDHAERTGKVRQRAMKKRDVEAMFATVEAIISSLMLAVLKPNSPPAIAVSLRSLKQGMSRYDRPGYSNLGKVLEVFASRPADAATGKGDVLGPWRLYKSRQRGTPSVVVAEPGFLIENMRQHIRSGALSLADFYREPGSEPIILTRTERDASTFEKASEWLDYTDTPTSRAFRAEMDRLNGALREADVGFVEDGGPPVPVLRNELRRYFSQADGDSEATPTFDRGGRLFGGWWQDIGRERRWAIRIDGEPIADLDYSNMFMRLAYVEAGVVPPVGDLYARVSGFDGPNLRPAVKKLANALFFRTTPMVRLPRDPELKNALPPGVTGAAMREAILAAHPALASIFETGAGMRLMFQESQILLAALFCMLDQGITALPMHDGVMVAKSRAAAAMQCMFEAADKIVGVRLPVVEKPVISVGRSQN